MVEIQKNHEIQRNGELGVHEETEALKRIIMWGEPGAEAVLGLLLPPEISCFQTDFDVAEARVEVMRAERMISSQGIEVVRTKDIFARMLDSKYLGPERSMPELVNSLQAKALYYKEKYRVPGLDKWPIYEWIEDFLERDAQVYGETTAVVMNSMLSRAGSYDLPLSNVVFSRDQSNLLGKTWVWSSMVHDIRQPEVSLYRRILEYGGIFKRSGVYISEVWDNGKFEGGDGIMFRGACYIGVGGRSNLDGVMQIAPSILESGRKVYVPYDEERSMGELNEMDAMHLDTFWMPCGEKEVVACDEEVKRRELLEVKLINGRPKIEKLGWFADYMKKEKINVVPLTKYEQEHYAPNFLNLGNNKIILSLTEGSDLKDRLMKMGKQVLCADLKNITKGYGGLHCLTAAIVRK